MSVLAPQTYSKAPERFPSNITGLAQWGTGAWVTIGGYEYVDTVNGLGAVILGHGHPEVTEAICDQANAGLSMPLATDLEYQVAHKLLSLLTWDGAEMVRFGKNGADVTSAAVRIARAVTGRDHIAYNGYHGKDDWCMVYPPKNGGVPEAVRELSVKVRDLGHLRRMLMTRHYAAFVVEPIVSATPVPPPAGYWREVRNMCTQYGTLLIADEMVTGFRMALGGACDVYDIRPDLACYGKAMANGMPLSALVGPLDLMGRINDDVFFSTTHGGECVSLAASLATMTVLEDENVPGQLGKLGIEIIEATGARGYPCRPVFDFTPKQLERLADARILCQGYVNISHAHCIDTTARSLLTSTLTAVANSKDEVT